MPRLHPTEEELKERQKRAKVWREFMANNLFTEQGLANTLGISRRTVQMIRAGNVSPHKDTLRLFESLKAKYDKEAKRSKASS
jgi:DNA-binding XRE family transcriptional regulator